MKGGRTAIRGWTRREDDASQGPHSRGPDDIISTPLRWRLALLTASVVTFAVSVMTLLAYWMVSTTLIDGIDRDLEFKADLMLSQTFNLFVATDLSGSIDQFKSHHPDMRVMIIPPGWVYPQGDNIPLDPGSIPTGGAQLSATTIGSERILVKVETYGSTIVLARDLTDTHATISSIGGVLLVIALLGVLLAIGTGFIVATAGLAPLQRLQRAVNRVAVTEDLHPIAVHGTDELAQLTRSFNTMLAALQESRTRQAQLVTDAGHELKTPLTSMRTNIELLMMMNQPGASTVLSAEDRADLERDVIAQMEEMSELIGDLVDLAREDASDTVLEDLSLDDVVESALERVRRRRTDVDFDVHLIPWTITGDDFSLSRAVLNLLDNAAKWSPPDGTVRVRMYPLSDDRVELTVSDSGPGIPEEDRRRVFERFYRSPEVRSQPGSGLGLAIVEQTVQRHGGAITVLDSDDGGTCMRVVLPRRRCDEQLQVRPHR